MKVKADPMFNEFGHQAWGFDCPSCGHYYESVDTSKEPKVECDSCGEEIEVTYLGNP